MARGKFYHPERKRPGRRNTLTNTRDFCPNADLTAVRTLFYQMTNVGIVAQFLDQDLDISVMNTMPVRLHWCAWNLLRFLKLLLVKMAVLLCQPRWRLVVAVLAMAFTAQAHAQGLSAPGARCEQAIGTAARANHVPGDLMWAIGMVESGRPDPVGGGWHPWPWAINAEGRGMFFNSKPEAIAAVRSLQASGVRSIDVGCMQVNLMHHPDAFASLDEAFDPARNALYAGHFLGSLYQRSSNWIVAAGWYHSATTELAADYIRRVTANLPGGKSGVLAAKGAVLSLNWRSAAPVVSRDGMVLPTVRLTSAGLVPVRSVGQPPRTKGRPGVRLAG
jgi:Transglycosylase SLT domain